MSDWYQPDRGVEGAGDPAGTAPLAGLVADAVARSDAGGCTNPVHLVGRTDIINPTTGEILDSFDGDRGRLLVPCGDRRAVVCPSCARVYRADTFQLIRAGLAGGKGVPEDGHPTSERLRHADRAVVRAGPHPAR